MAMALSIDELAVVLHQDQAEDLLDYRTRVKPTGAVIELTNHHVED